MADLAAIRNGAIGYWWEWPTEKIGPLPDETVRAGFVRERNGAIELQLLVEDVDTLTLEPRPSVPRSIVGVTELGGVLLTDIVFAAPRINVGGSRASVDTFIARTIIADPDVIEATTSDVAALSMHFAGDAMLRWGGFDAVEESFTTGADKKVVEASLRLRAAPDHTIKLSRGLDLVASAYWKTTPTPGRGREISTALAMTVQSKGAPRAFADRSCRCCARRTCSAWHSVASFRSPGGEYSSRPESSGTSGTQS